MNCVLCTGWIQSAATLAYTPGGRQKLTFLLMVASKISGGQPTPWQCEVEEEALIQTAEPMLTSGRALIVKGELCGRPYTEKGVLKGFSRYLAINAIEFARIERGKAASVAADGGEEGQPGGATRE